MSEWLMVIITAIYALLTFFIWKSNKDSVQEMKLSREVSYRPEVIAYLYERDRGLYFRIENIGSRMAFNVDIILNPSFNIYTGINKNNFMKVYHDELGNYDKKHIKVLAPNQYLETFVGVQQEIINRYSKPDQEISFDEADLEAGVEISYSDYENRDTQSNFKEYYTLTLAEFQSQKGILRYTTHDLVHEMRVLNSNFKDSIRK